MYINCINELQSLLEKHLTHLKLHKQLQSLFDVLSNSMLPVLRIKAFRTPACAQYVISQSLIFLCFPDEGSRRTEAPAEGKRPA